MNRVFRGALFPILIVIVLAFFVSKLISPSTSNGPPHNFKTFTQSDRHLHGQVKSWTADPSDDAINVTLVGGEKYTVGYDAGSTQLQSIINTTLKAPNDPPYNVVAKSSSTWSSLLLYLLPFVLFFGLWFLLMNNLQGGGSKVMSFGKSPRYKRLSADSPKISFRDVAGVDEAVEELHEIKEFLENPKKFQALGARIPTGVLLYGPPGTGKTLLARAVAGEAGVPFFSISGSDFVEMFVGVGASRVRDLFEQAKQNSPCIIFMDEIDAVGRHRAAPASAAVTTRREQTLNQLLVEMDGFEAKDNIIMIAATNRPDILGPGAAAPRPLQTARIAVDRPDRKGRAKILEVHTRGKPLAKGHRHRRPRRSRRPASPAQTSSNLINEAALLAARTGKRADRPGRARGGHPARGSPGPRRRHRVMSEKERKITAYHEMGHALVEPRFLELHQTRSTRSS